MFTKKNTVNAILSSFTSTIAALLVVQTEQTTLADKKFGEALAATAAGEAARAEAVRAAAVASKFQKMVDTESN